MGFVGDFICNVAEGVLDGVSAAGDFIGGVFGDFFGGSSGYHPGPSENESHVKKIADELAEMKEKVRKRSEKQEEKILKYINQSLEQLIKGLENVNHQEFGGKTLNINIENIKRQYEYLKNDVVGFIGNEVDGKLVLTDSELSVILKERNDRKRNKSFDDFCKKLERQVTEKLSRKIESTVKKQEKIIRTEIEIRLNEVNRSMEEAQKAYTEILKIKEQDESKMAETQIKYMYQYELSEILLDQLGG